MYDIGKRLNRTYNVLEIKVDIFGCVVFMMSDGYQLFNNMMGLNIMQES